MIGVDYARTLVMPTQSLPVGDNTSPTALCSESHMNTQHTVTGECGHYCCTSEGSMYHQPSCNTASPGCYSYWRESPFGCGATSNGTDFYVIVKEC